MKKNFFFYFLFFFWIILLIYIYFNVVSKHDDSWARQKGVAQWLEHAWGWRVKFAIYADYGDAWVLEGCWIRLLPEPERVKWVMQITYNWLMIHLNGWESIGTSLITCQFLLTGVQVRARAVSFIIFFFFYKKNEK